MIVRKCSKSTLRLMDVKLRGGKGYLEEPLGIASHDHQWFPRSLVLHLRELLQKHPSTVIEAKISKGILSSNR